VAKSAPDYEYRLLFVQKNGITPGQSVIGKHHRKAGVVLAKLVWHSMFQAGVVEPMALNHGQT
jgi:hypothetical protein